MGVASSWKSIGRVYLLIMSLTSLSLCIVIIAVVSCQQGTGGTEESCPHEASPNISYIDDVCTCEGCDLTINFILFASNRNDCSVEENHYDIDIYHHNNQVHFEPRPNITGLDIHNNSSTSCNVSLVIQKNTTFIGTNITVLQQEYDNSTVQVYVIPSLPRLCSNNFTLRVQGVSDPVIITDSIVNCSGVYISWERPYSLSCVPILGYIIHILELNYTDTTTSEHYMISSSSDILMDSTQYTISIRSVNGAGTSNGSNITINSSLAPIVYYSGYDIVIINRTTSYITINARVSDDCRPSHPSSVSVHISCGNDDDPIDYTSDVIVNDDGLTKVSLFVPTGFIHCTSNITWSNSNSSISQSHLINTSPLYDVNITSISNGMINYTCHFRNYSQLKGCGISLDDNVSSSVILYDDDSLMSTGSLILPPMCSDMIYNVTIFYKYINDDVNYTFNVTTVTVNSSNITCFPSPTESSQPTVTDSIMFSPSPTESSQFTVTDSSISPSTTSPSGPQLEYIIPIVILVVIVLVLIIVVVVLVIIIFNRKKKNYLTKNDNGHSTDLNTGVYSDRSQLNGGSNGNQSGQNGIEMTNIRGTEGTVPGAEGTVPRAEGTIPGTEGTVPGAEGTVPGAEGTVLGAEGTAVPGAKGTVPVAKGTVPGTEGTIPGTERTVPGAEGTVPGAEGTVLGAEGTAVPGAKGTVPVAKGTVPGTEGTIPGTERTVPGAEGTVLGTEGTVPGAEGTVLGTEGTVPGAEGTVLGTEGEGTVPGAEGTVLGTEGTVPQNEETTMTETISTKSKAELEQGDVEIDTTEGSHVNLISKGSLDAYQYSPLSSDHNTSLSQTHYDISDDKEGGMFLIPSVAATTAAVSGGTIAIEPLISSTSEYTSWSGDYNKSSSDLSSLIKDKRSPRNTTSGSNRLVTSSRPSPSLPPVEYSELDRIIHPQPLGAKGTGSPHTDIDKGYTSTNTKTHAEPLLSHDSINQNDSTATALGNVDLSYESNNSVKEKEDILDYTSAKEETTPPVKTNTQNVD